MKYRENPSEPWKEYYIKALDSMVIGSIIQFVGATIPTGWLECDGSTITQSAYPELYDLIGGTLPDFRGRVLVGQDTNDTDFDTLLETGGSKELQAHNHVQYRGYQVSGFSAPYMSTMTGWGFVDSTLGTELHNIGSAGTGNSGNLQPYGVVKHIIKATNTTPTMASIVNGYSTSTQDGYSCDYVNDKVDGVELYSGSSTSGNIPLSDNISNYSKVDIVVKSRTGMYNTYTLLEPNGKATELRTGNGETGLTTYYSSTICTLSFSGTTATRSNDRYYMLQHGGSVTVGTDVSYYSLAITKIIGYK